MTTTPLRVKANTSRSIAPHLISRPDHSEKYEAVPLPAGLEIEHVMPRGWRTHWDAAPPLTTDEAVVRDKYINTIGNLTLVTKSLNAALSNRPWTDSAALGLKDGGEPGKGKRTLLDVATSASTSSPEPVPR